MSRKPADPLLEGVEDALVEKTLRRWIAAGLGVAILLTGFMGFMSLRSARLASEGADLVAHTHAVETSLSAVLEHASDIETGSRGFAVTGDESFLQPYQEAIHSIGRELNAVRGLTADNPAQQRRLDQLKVQIDTRIELSQMTVAERRRTSAIPPKSLFLEGKRRMDAVHAAVGEMQADEDRQIKERTNRLQAARRFQTFATLASTVVGVLGLLLPGFAIFREINKSVQMRAQLKALNASLEQRVEQRTAALESEITERKQATQALAEQAEELAHSRQALEAQSLMLQSVLDSMAEGLVTADEQGKLVIWNPAAEKILGRGATDLPPEQWSEHYGVFLADMVTPLPTDQIPMVRALRGETSTTQLFVHSPALAEGVWIEASGGPLKDKNGAVRGGVVAFRDITPKRTAERKIQQLNNELEQRVALRTAELLESNQELEAFTYSVSHDLRAPLRHMAGFSGILLDEYGDKLDTQAQKYLQRIQDATGKMGRLVDELLSLARVGRQALKLEPTRLNALVEEVVFILEPETQGRQIDWKIANLPVVECDPILIKQVFQNLLANALKYSRPRAQTVIEVGTVEENGQPAIFVRDNGVGFNMKYADKLFGVFQRLHRTEDFEGTGVGLVTAQRIVKKHNGRIWAEAELDRGATFYFTLSGLEQAKFKSKGASVGAHT